jgi:hypothetical protein
MLFVIDFVNIKIKPTQSFKIAHMSRVYVRVFTWVSPHIYIYISIYICTIFLEEKKILSEIGARITGAEHPVDAGILPRQSPSAPAPYPTAGRYNTLPKRCQDLYRGSYPISN